MKKILLFILLPFSLLGHELRWDWAKINTDQVSFSKNFLWGVSISEYQVSGATHLPDSNWAYWEHSLHHKSGKACDHWQNMNACIDCIKQLGVKAFRFSVEWSKIEPIQGFIDEKALQKYKDFCYALRQAGIEPVVTLHHFTHPQWFEDKKAFECEENIEHFVNFCTKVFEELHDSVTLWVTINEPGVYAFQGYVRGVFPPGDKGRIVRAGHVLKNLCIAHTHAYRALKAMPSGDKAQIGIVHNILQFEAYHDNNPLENKVCSYLNMILNDAVLNFFKTGIFAYQFLKTPVSYTDLQASQTLDFVGLNYYSHVLWNWRSPSAESYREGDIKTDMPYPLYPEGFYRAIKTISTLNVPIYITENGIADSRDDRRALWIQRYVYAMHKAMQEGCDVRGFFYWSLMDNFEWDEGYEKCFGLFHVDFETGKRTLRAGAQPFVDLVTQTYA